MKLACSAIHIALFIMFCTVTSVSAQSQNVGIGTSSPDSSAALEVSADGQGILIPRMDSTTRLSISSPAIGLMVYDSTTHGFWYYTHVGWTPLNGSSVGAYYCLDHDGDGAGNPLQPVWVPNGVAPPGGFVFNCSDPNDADSTVYIGAPCDESNPNTMAIIDSNGICVDTSTGSPPPFECAPDSCGPWNVLINGECEYGSCWTTGIATIYGSGQGGACGWDNNDLLLSPFNGKIAAVGADLWNSGLACGDVYDLFCITDSNTINSSVTCSGDTVRVMVVDQCPECSNTHLDLSDSAWAAILTGPPGIADIEFRRVGHEYGVNLQIDIKDGPNPFFVQFYPKFSNKTIVNIEVSPAGTTDYYQASHSTNQGFWTIDGGSGIPVPVELPLSFRFTSNDGDILPAADVVTTLDPGNQDSGVNFSFD